MQLSSRLESSVEAHARPRQKGTHVSPHRLAWWQGLSLLAAGAYLVFCLTLAVCQRRLIYFPQPLDETQAQIAYQRHGVERWPTENGCRGAILRNDTASPETNGTVLVFHGNAGGAHERAFIAKTFRRLGWRTVLAEYPGYGPQPGVPGEVAFLENGRETARLVRRLYPERLVILGESLGSGVAAAVAADPELKADALVLAVPFDRLTTVAARHYPWLPVRWLLRDRYDNVARLRNFEGPITVIQAGADEVVPVESTQTLFDSLPRADRKRLVRLPDTTHNGWFWPLTDKQWREILSR